MVNSLLTHAMEYHEAGLTVIPCHQFDAVDDKGEPLGKSPIGRWKQWQRRAQTPADIERQFSNHTGNMAVIGGRQIGNGYLYWAEFDDAGRWRETAQELARMGVETWQTQSKRGGHIWGASSKPVKTHAYDWGEVRGWGAYVVAPPSIHPSGIPYTFRAKPDQIARIDSMPGLPALELMEPPANKLSRLVSRILNHDPATLAKYHSRSEIDFALIASLVNSGFAPEAILSLIVGSTYPSHCRELQGERRIHWFYAAYHKLKSQGNTPAFNEAKDYAERVLAWATTASAQDISTNMRTAAADRAALMAHAQIAAKVGRLEYQLSARDGAVLAGMDSKTFCKASKRITGRFIEMTAEGFAGGLANRWRLKPSLEQVPTLTYTLLDVCECRSLFQMDTKGVFSHRTRTAPPLTLANIGSDRPKIPQGLGRACGDTWRKLIGCMMTADELATATGRNLKTIEKHLDRLTKTELVMREGDTYTAVATPAVIERAAHYLHTTEVDVKREKRFDDERAAHREDLAAGIVGNHTALHPKFGRYKRK